VNIALPALIVLIGLLPGIAVYYSYFAGRFEKRRAGVSALEEAALYVLFSIPILVISFLLLRSIGIHLDLRTIGHLLVGNVPESEIARIAAQLEAHAALTAFSYLAIVMASAALGWAARHVVWRYRIDTKIEIFRWRHPWYYMFEGRHGSLPPGALAWVDVLAEHSEDRTRLYRGLVFDYDMVPDGKLESITLNGARRGRGRGDTFEWIAIPSSHLVVMGCKIHSINVTYHDINDEPDESELKAAEDVPRTGEAGVL